ncbi:MAG TPA: DUF3307 domain-containing protein [Parvularculaceae bacterium]|nr:DUF3307 domain-containing protein [Parvularculaceae bacterium]
MSDQLQYAFILLIIFQIKHFLGDFVFQTNWMVAGKARADLSYLFPLTVHVLVHAVQTAIIVLIVSPALWGLAIFDFAVHFVMDRIKSGPRYLGRYNDVSKSSFWICLGFDQMVHHLTHFAIVWWILLYRAAT